MQDIRITCNKILSDDWEYGTKKEWYKLVVKNIMKILQEVKE